MGEGNPASLIRLKDRRLCLTYGFRARAVLDPGPSQPGRRAHRAAGAIILRDDGGGRDLGYPRSVQRADGKVVTVYYFWDRATGPERYIAATIWDPE